MKIPSKQELQQIAINNSLVIDFKVFIKVYIRCTIKSYYFSS